MRLLDSPPGRVGGGDRGAPHTLGRANFIIECYGIHAFLADIDSGRDYWREANGSDETIIQSCLSWLMEEGFGSFFDQFDLAWPHGSRLQWQQRYMLALWKS